MRGQNGTDRGKFDEGVELDLIKKKGGGEANPESGVGEQRIQLLKGELEESICTKKT